MGAPRISDWNANLYDSFGDQRQWAARDLVDAIGDGDYLNITDLGCGSGLSTELLSARWPKARITALDNSPAMLEKAAKRVPGATLLQADIANYNADDPQDLILANASLHWLPSHADLLPRLFQQLNDGGVLAIQMPNNLQEPSHALMEVVAQHDAYRNYLSGGKARRSELLSPEAYYNLLAPLGAGVQIWETRYRHVLSGVDAIVSWFSSTGLKPYLDPLPDGLREDYLARYRHALTEAYAPLADGKVMLAMPRLFILAKRIHRAQ